jgi:hypothetical protein
MGKWHLSLLFVLGLVGIAGSVSRDFKVLYQPFGINIYDSENYRKLEPVVEITSLLGDRDAEFLEYFARAEHDQCELVRGYGSLKLVRDERTLEVDGRGCIWDGESSRKMSKSDFRNFRLLLDEVVPGSERVTASQLGRKAGIVNDSRGTVMGREFEAMQLAWKEFTKNRKGQKLDYEDVLISVESIEGKSIYGGYRAMRIPDSVPAIAVIIEPRLLLTYEDMMVADGPENRAVALYRASDLKLIGAFDEITY